MYIWIGNGVIYWRNNQFLFFFFSICFAYHRDTTKMSMNQFYSSSSFSSVQIYTAAPIVKTCNRFIQFVFSHVRSFNIFLNASPFSSQSKYTLHIESVRYFRKICILLFICYASILCNRSFCENENWTISQLNRIYVRVELRAGSRGRGRRRFLSGRIIFLGVFF